MSITFCSRAEALDLNPHLAAAVHAFQRSCDPSDDPFEVGQEVYLELTDDEPVTLDAALCEKLNRETMEEYQARCDQFDAPPGKYKPDGFHIAFAYGGDIVELLENNAGAWLRLTEKMGWGPTAFVGCFVEPWLGQRNDYPPMLAAHNRLTELGLSDDYRGGIIADGKELQVLVRDLFAVARYNASAPYTYLAAQGADTIAMLCKYGNYHLETCGKPGVQKLEQALPKAGLEIEPDGMCHEPFGDDDLLEGRRLDLS